MGFFSHETQKKDRAESVNVGEGGSLTPSVTAFTIISLDRFV